jgi:predicted nucleic acid-binding Zn ribbon protein
MGVKKLRKTLRSSRRWNKGQEVISYQDVLVLGLAVRAGEVGEEVLGERCGERNRQRNRRVRQNSF